MRLVAMFAVIALSACGVTPKQAGDATDAACKIVEAFQGGAVVDSICATAPELAQIAVIVAESRSDASAPRMASKCRTIPDTSTCATDAELLIAIRKVKADR